MSGARRALWALAAFALGCAAATVAQPLVVPLAKAGAATQKWEQLCVPHRDEAHDNAQIVKDPYPHAVNTPTGWNRVLAEYGRQGWELVTFDAGLTLACFKRPL